MNRLIYPLKANFKWDEQSEFIYKSALTSDVIGNQITAVLQMTENELCIDEMLSKVDNILKSAAQGALKERKYIQKLKLRKRNGLIEIVLDLGKKFYVLEGKFVDLKQRMNNNGIFSKKKELRKW